MIFQRFLQTNPPDPPVVETEPIIAYRSWRLVETPEGVPILYSAVQDYCWPPYEAAHGDPEGSAGLFAFKKLEDALSFADGTSVLGEVSLWGTVVEHAGGYRAEFAYPKRLFLPPSWDPAAIVRIEETYGVPVEFKEIKREAEAFHSSHFSPGIVEVVSDIVYDHEPIKGRVKNLFCIPIGQNTVFGDGSVLTKTWEMTNMLISAQLQAPERFLLRGIRLIFFKNGIPLPISDPIYWSSSFEFRLVSKSYLRCPCGLLADPGIVMQNTNWSKIPPDQRANLLSRSEFKLSAPGAEIQGYAPIGKTEGVLIDQQMTFSVRLGFSKPWSRRSVLCVLTGLHTRMVM